MGMSFDIDKGFAVGCFIRSIIVLIGLVLLLAAPAVIILYATR